jgi:hypothetical protein
MLELVVLAEFLLISFANRGQDEFEIAVNACVRKDGFQYAKKKEGNTICIVCKARDCDASFVAVKSVSENNGSSWRVTSVNRLHTCSSTLPSSSSSSSPVRVEAQNEQQRMMMPTPSESDHSSEVSMASSAHVASLLMRKKDTPPALHDKGKGRETAARDSSSIATPKSDIKTAISYARKSAPRVSFPASPATIVILQCKGCEDRGVLCSGKPAENRLCPECIHYNGHSGRRHITCGIASKPRRTELVLDAGTASLDAEEEFEMEQARLSTSQSKASRRATSELAERRGKVPTLDNLFDDVGFSTRQSDTAR